MELNMPSNNKTEQSVQELHNQSFDNDFKVNTVEPVVFNPATNNLDRMIQPTVPTDVQLGELIPLFRALLMAIANPSYVDKSANQMRAQVTGTITTVTTTTTVTNLTNIGSFPGNHLQIMNNKTAWATNIRSLIT